MRRIDETAQHVNGPNAANPVEPQGRRGVCTFISLPPGCL